MAQLNVKELIDSGIHFGHRTSRWNPKMAPYIFGKRNLIHIIDLKETIKGILRAKKLLTPLVARGKDALFVGTKRQAQVSVAHHAARVGMPWVSERWLGGSLTNFDTVRQRLKYLEDLEAMEVDGRMEKMSKKMVAYYRREKRKVFRNLSGIRTMNRLPGAMILVDPMREATAVREARKLGIPIIALADTESDPDDVDILIPGNDDSTRAIDIVLGQLADAVAEGKANRPEGVAEAQAEAPQEAPPRRAPPPRRKTLTVQSAPEKPAAAPEKPVAAAESDVPAVAQEPSPTAQEAKPEAPVPDAEQGAAD